MKMSTFAKILHLNMREELSEKMKVVYLPERDEVVTWGHNVECVGYQKVQPGDKYPLKLLDGQHTYNPRKGCSLDRYLLGYIDRGQGVFVSKTMRITRIEAGTFFLVRPNEWFTVFPDEQTGWDEYWVEFSGDEVNRIISQGAFTLGASVFEVKEELPICVTLMKEMVKIAESYSFDAQSVISSSISRILGQLYYFDKRRFHTKMDSDHRLLRALSLIHQKPRVPDSIDSICESIGTGVSWFRSSFRSFAGMPPNKYIMSLRIAYAKELLMTTDWSISKIAETLDFETADHFSTFFHKMVGMTASDFRKTTRY